ncbi:MAG: arsenosugar biosynthesis radical SAM (seleno)protein ArsS [Thermodesulfobacteriota bacterium]
MITPFPAINRVRLETLQVNLGYRCNQQCAHCHVNAGPDRKEMMGLSTLRQVMGYLHSSGVKRLDLTGGAPELNPHFREMIREARKIGVHVIDRCNLTILEESGQEDLPQFLAENRVEITASMPCYLQENVNRQRGIGVYEKSIRALQRLNYFGYGKENSELILNLVYNPLGPFLPPPQKILEDDYRRELGEHYGIVFHRLLTMTNMPIHRFRKVLISNGELSSYMEQLRSAHQDINLDSLMCRTLISVDWQGHVYDCDFNQMLGLPLYMEDNSSVNLSDMIGMKLEGRPIAVREHCYGCTAGQGSSCTGALSSPMPQ